MGGGKRVCCLKVCLEFPDIVPLHNSECLQILKIGHQIKRGAGREQERKADSLSRDIGKCDNLCL